MTPPATFRSELGSYRDLLISAGTSPNIALHLQVIDRWGAHGEVEQTWKTLTESIPADDMLTPYKLIRLVLKRRDLLERLDACVREYPERKSRAKALAKRLANEADHMKAAAMADTLAKERWSFADIDRRIASLLGRKRKTGAQKIFIQGWVDKFKERCGKPLATVVRVLAEVAFDQEFTEEAIRGYLRPTTRAERRNARRSRP
jgi:hypothetical protein